MTPPSKSESPERPLLLVNIRQLLTLRSRNPGPRRGPDLQELGIIKDGAVLCLSGKIVSACKTKDALRDPWIKKNRRKIVEIDCAGQVVLPGLVDSHTHPVFVTPRLVDLRSASPVPLTNRSRKPVEEFVRVSRVYVRPAKTSCGQGVGRAAGNGRAGHDHSRSQVRIWTDRGFRDQIAGRHSQRGRKWPGTVMATLLGAHVVPKEFQGRAQEYVDLVCTQMIPLVARKKLAQFVDVFTDRGAFTVEDTEKIFDAAKKHGLGVRAHVCQLSQTALRPLLRSMFRHSTIWITPATRTYADWPNTRRLRRWCRARTNSWACKNFRQREN